MKEYSVTKIISNNQKYLFYFVIGVYLVTSVFVVSMFAVGCNDYVGGVQWVLIGGFLFSFLKMTEYEHDRFLYMFLTVLALLVYFHFDLIGIVVIGFLFFVLGYIPNLFKDCRQWFKENKITL